MFILEKAIDIIFIISAPVCALIIAFWCFAIYKLWQEYGEEKEDD